MLYCFVLSRVTWHDEASVIQAVLAAPGLTPESKNAAIAAITAANARSCGSLSRQNALGFSGDKLPLVAS